MIEIIAVVAADLHLQPQTWINRPTLCGDEYRGLQQAIEVANKHNVPLILAGDIFNKVKPDSNSVRVFVDSLTELNNVCYCLRGNHDMADPPWTSLSSKTQDVDQTVFDLKGVKFLAYDYKPPGVLKKLLETASAVDVTIVHQSWSEIQGVGADASIAELFVGGMVVSGDCHITTQGVVPSARDGKPINFVSPGSTAMQAINEPPVKHVAVIYREDGHIKAGFEQIQTRPMWNVEVETEARLEEIVGQLRQLSESQPDERPILRVMFPETLPQVPAALEGNFDHKVHLFLSPQEVIEEFIPVGIQKDADLTTLPLTVSSLDTITPHFRDLLLGAIQTEDLSSYLKKQKLMFMESQYEVSTTTADQLLPTP